MDQETNIFWYTVDGRNPNHQLIDGKHPIIYRLSAIQGGAGFCIHCQDSKKNGATSLTW